MLEIKDLHVEIEGKAILKGLSLTIRAGECHAIMGPNGAGKSTLAKVLAGHPAYEVVQGEVLFRGENLLEKEPEERAHLGLFMSFQYPPEVAGITLSQFLHEALNAQRKACGKELFNEEGFSRFLEKKLDEVEMKREFKERGLNEGFSGGEKKRCEILQMALFEPYLALLDETDSGLDIDAMKSVAKGVNSLRSKERSLLLITHYQRLLDYIVPDFVHVFMDGKIILSGAKELALTLEERGYDWLDKR